MTEETIINNDETANTAETLATASWLESLPQELKGAESLTKFKDVGQLAQSYLEAEKALSSRIAIPDEKADNEAWAKFYQRLGLPEDKRYTEKRTAEDEQYLQAYEQMFYDNGLSKRQGEKLLNSLYDYSNKIEQQQQKQSTVEAEKAKGENLQWLQSNYGNEFDARMSGMQAALKEFGSRELAEMLEDSLFAPALVDMLAKVGATLKSDSLVDGNAKAPISSKEQALQEIKKLESSPDFVVKLSSKDHGEHAEAVERMRELHNIAYN